MRHFRIRKGEWPSAKGVPAGTVCADLPAGSVAILGADYPGMRPRFEVEKDAFVGAGQVLFRDRKHPQIAFVSPLAGRVTSIDFGARRTLSACIIEAETTQPDTDSCAVPNLDKVRQTLLDRGFWPAFRTRPFGRLPAPDAKPAAILVNAVRAAPQAPDPQVVLAGDQDAFRLGVQCLERLTEGDVFVCQSPGAPLASEGGQTKCVAFSGSLAAGLASTQIDRLCPPAPDCEVWIIGFQDVAAIGHLFRTGRYRSDRVVSISGSGVTRPRLVRTCLGTRLADLTDAEEGEAFSGGATSEGRAAYLGRYDDQVTLRRQSRHRHRSGWLERLSGHPKALIPNRQLERALAVDIPVVPLLRALSVGDSEAARRLGCLSLVEEDVAALARRCTSGADYPRLLRQVLDRLTEEIA